MKFGLALSVQHRAEDPQAARFQEHVEQVRLARAVGFDSVWASQHYLSDPFTYFQPIPTLRVGRLEEGLEVIQRLWSGEPVTHRGRHFALEDVRISMPTLQRPRPPIWLAANGDPGVRRAARLGDAWLMNPHATLGTLERQVALFRQTRVALGRPPASEVPLIKECYVAPRAAAALAEARPYLEPKYAAYARWEQDKALPAGETFALDFAALARDRFILGDPEAVGEEIARYRERLGLTTMIFRLQWPGLPQDTVLRAIRLLGERILPRLR